MQQRTYARRFMMGLLSLGLLVGAVVMAGPAQAQTTSVGPYYATPSWDQTLPAATRFIVLSNFDGAAVLDRETGLVWEKAPDSTPRTWGSATSHCVSKIVGPREGWRLPSVMELASLIDRSSARPFVPASVFTGIQVDLFVPSSFYWSATTSVENPIFAWTVNFIFGGVGTMSKTVIGHAWCVRGGMNADAY